MPPERLGHEKTILTERLPIAAVVVVLDDPEKPMQLAESLAPRARIDSPGPGVRRLWSAGPEGDLHGGDSRPNLGEGRPGEPDQAPAELLKPGNQLGQSGGGCPGRARPRAPIGLTLRPRRWIGSAVAHSEPLRRHGRHPVMGLYRLGRYDSHAGEARPRRPPGHPAGADGRAVPDPPARAAGSAADPGGALRHLQWRR